MLCQNRYTYYYLYLSYDFIFKDKNYKQLLPLKILGITIFITKYKNYYIIKNLKMVIIWKKLNLIQSLLSYSSL